MLSAGRLCPGPEPVGLGGDDLLGQRGLGPPAGETLRNDRLQVVDVVQVATGKLVDAGIQIAVPTDEVLGLESFYSVVPRDASVPDPPGELALGLLRRSDGVATLLLQLPPPHN